MAIIDIVVIVIALIFLLVGMKVGFLKSILGLVSFALTLLGVFILSKPFANALASILPFDNWIETPISNWLTSMGGVMTQEIPSTTEGMAAAIQTAGLPAFIADAIAPNLVSIVPSDLAGTTFAGFFAPQLFHLVMIGIAGILLLILFSIAFSIVTHFVLKVLNVPGLGVLDKVLGTLLGAIKAFIFFLVTFTLLSFVIHLNFMAPVKENLEKSTISKFVYENNFLSKFIFEKLNFKPSDTDDAPGETSALQNNTAFYDKHFLKNAETDALGAPLLFNANDKLYCLTTT